jgi:hypothetical protein
MEIQYGCCFFATKLLKLCFLGLWATEEKPTEEKL